jgi:hypothetical protein
MHSPRARKLSIPMILLASTIGLAQGTGAVSPPATASSGGRELAALARAYPDRIKEASFYDGDWSLLMDGVRYYWAHGRILPEQRREQWRQYAALRFYRYSPGPLPPLPSLNAEEASRLQRMVREANARPPRRWEGFLETLFQAGSRKETESRLTTVSFLGFKARVHQRIAAALERTARECAVLSGKDPEVAGFFAGLRQIDGYQYRDVAGTLSRSYHSYGLALDMIPRSYGGLQTYWRWSTGIAKQWWAIPYKERWMPPMSVVSAFESNGFVWGGKWLFFDTMHFEYRPEILMTARGSGPG